MTKQEALDWLYLMKWHLSDTGHKGVAYMVADADSALYSMTHGAAKEYARFVLEPGHRGRVTLALSDPYDARAIAMLYGILMSIEE